MKRAILLILSLNSLSAFCQVNPDSLWAILNDSNQREVILQEYEYELQKQAIVDSLLTVKHIKTQESKNERNKLISIFGGVISVIIIASIYIRYRSIYSLNAKLKENEKKLLLTQESMDASNDNIFWIDPNNASIVNCNAQSDKRLGYTREKLLSLSVFDVNPEFNLQMWSEFSKKLREKGSLKFETKHQTIQGEIFIVDINAVYIKYGGEEFFCAIIRDITERKKNEENLKMAKEAAEELSKSLEFVQFAMDQSVDMVFWFDLETARISYANVRASNCLQYTQGELVKMKISDIDTQFPKEDENRWKTLADELRTSAPLMFESIHKTKSGEIYPVEITTQYVEFGGEKRAIAVARDITERKKNEENLKIAKEQAEEQNEALEIAIGKLKEAQTQLVRSEKMASLGQLTAGIAHEINNPVSFLQTSSFALENDLNDITYIVEKYREFLKKSNIDISEITDFEKIIDYDILLESIKQEINDIKEGTKRTTEIVRGLRQFSHEDNVEMELADIHDGIDSSLNLMSIRLKEGVILIKNYDQSINEITCHIGQLNQLFLNLLTNALDAMSDKGELEITTEKNVKGITISIKDDGQGIPEDIKNNIFDPFFTTKKVGEGTGLGLSICHGIIERHGGTIEVKSEVGKGSEFVITLPMK